MVYAGFATCQVRCSQAKFTTSANRVCLAVDKITKNYLYVRKGLNLHIFVSKRLRSKELENIEEVQQLANVNLKVLGSEHVANSNGRSALHR